MAMTSTKQGKEKDILKLEENEIRNMDSMYFCLEED
jgi:hypothetical protein